MDKKIEMLIRKLNWNLPIDVQNKAIDELTKIDEESIELLIQPFIFEKKYWENAAKVIKKIGYPKNHSAIPGLLNWLQDINWPGASIAMECLQSVDTMVLLPYIEAAIEKAIIDNDDLWLMSLKELVINRLSINIDEFKNKDIFNILQQIE